MSVVVSDASPLRVLDHVRLHPLLSEVFGEVLIPTAVQVELERPSSALPPLSWQSFPGLRVHAVHNVAHVAELRRELDAGEAEAIALAIEVGAVRLLVDERKATRVSLRLGIPTTGVLALLVMAKELGKVPAVRPLLETVQRDLGFFVAPRVKDEILRLAGE